MVNLIPSSLQTAVKAACLHDRQSVCVRTRFDGGDIGRAITLGSLDLTLNLMFDEWGFEVLVFRSFGVPDMLFYAANRGPNIVFLIAGLAKAICITSTHLA